MTWFRMSVGRAGNAEPRWIVPFLCRRGHITNADVGKIVIRERETQFEIARDVAERFAAAARRPDAKDRDILVEPPELQAAIRERLARRLFPFIRMAMGFSVTRTERLLVSCYDADDGGVFHPHRDNTTQGTAHRRFACSLNLNADFEGGDLRFAEYGPATYRPPPGGAVVFSCALMHEATPVTRGRRYASLPFLYDDAAAKIRDANRHLIVDASAPPAATTNA